MHRAPNLAQPAHTGAHRRAQARARVPRHRCVMGAASAVSQCKGCRVAGVRRCVVELRRPCRGRVLRAPVQCRGLASRPCRDTKPASWLPCLSQYTYMYCNTNLTNTIPIASVTIQLLYRDMVFTQVNLAILLQYKTLLQYNFSHSSPSPAIQT